MMVSNAIVATVFALAAAAVSCVCRRPALVHGLWLLVLVKLITPPILPVEIFRVPVAEPVPPASALATLPLSELRVPDEREMDENSVAWIDDVPEDPPESIVQEKEPPVVEILPPQLQVPGSFSWSTWVAVFGRVWLAGSLVWLAVAGYRIYHFQRLLTHATPAPKELQDQAQKLAELLGLARCPDIWLVPGAISPMIWPVGARSRLLVPAELLNRLSWEQRATLLVHELAHLRRHDHWARALELVVTGLYWWHPVVWWARREISEAEEQCCDAWVVWALPDAARSYASALLETVDFLAGARPVLLPPAASGLGQFRILKRRLHMIMIGNTPRAMSRAGFLAVLGLGLLLPVLPTWGQQSGDDDKRTEKKEIIKKSVDDALRKLDMDKIKNFKEDLIKHLDKDIKIDKDMIKKIQADVIQELDIDIGKIQKDVIKDLDDLIKSADRGDDLRLKDLTRAKEDVKRALAQIIEARVQVDDPGQPKDLDRAKDEFRRAEAQLAEARARFQKAQAELQEAKARLLGLEHQMQQLHRSRARQENVERATKVREAREEELRHKQAPDKAEWKEKAERSRKDRFDKAKDGRRSDEDLEQRFEKLLKEVQDLGRELKRRRAEDRRPNRDEQEEEGAKP
jgi:beta-lactamase regulating signal transducer with metallopeptidase domain